MARPSFYIVDFIHFIHFPHFTSFFNIFSKNMGKNYLLRLYISIFSGLIFYNIFYSCPYATAGRTSSHLSSAVGEFLLSVLPRATPLLTALPTWVQFFLTLLFTAKMWRLVIMLILYSIPSTYQYSLVVNAGEEVRPPCANQLSTRFGSGFD